MSEINWMWFPVGVTVMFVTAASVVFVTRGRSAQKWLASEMKVSQPSDLQLPFRAFVSALYVLAMLAPFTLALEGLGVHTFFDRLFYLPWLREAAEGGMIAGVAGGAVLISMLDRQDLE